MNAQWRRLPRRGIGYGLLRYLSGDTDMARTLQALPHADVLFNYLGQYDHLLAPTSRFTLAAPLLLSCSPRNPRQPLLEVNAFVLQDQLQVAWTYSNAIHRAATIQTLADDFLAALRLFIAGCHSPQAGGHTPADFPLAQLDAQKLSRITQMLKDIDRSEEPLA